MKLCDKKIIHKHIKKGESEDSPLNIGRCNPTLVI